VHKEVLIVPVGINRMPSAAYELVVLGVGMATALMLLAIGSWAGYWAGTRLVAQSLVPAAWIDERTKIFVDLDRCIQESDHVSDQCASLARLGENWESIPSELAIAIDRLTNTTAGLAAQLRQIQRIESSSTPPQGQQFSEAPSHSSNGNSAPRISHGADSASVRLTNDQITEALAGRRKIDDFPNDPDAKRYPYDCYQCLAPWNDGAPPPDRDKFVRIRCHEISVNGISFFLPQAPDFDSLVISIGAGKKLLFMHARVCDQKVVFMHNDVSHLVQCRYLHRMDELTAHWHMDEVVSRLS
jgi:hypothetical protein